MAYELNSPQKMIIIMLSLCHSVNFWKYALKTPTHTHKYKHTVIHQSYATKNSHRWFGVWVGI